MADRAPAEVFPPGEFIREELEERGWKQADLAMILGRPLPVVNAILSGKTGITPDTAKGLAAAFGTSPEFWLRTDAAYQLSRVRESHGGVAQRARIYAKAPVREMIKRRWIEPSSNPRFPHMLRGEQTLERRVTRRGRHGFGAHVTWQRP
jgi:HTH-type transcriptional regulator/antitoxin HigA